MINVWGSMSLGVIFATMILQILNFKVFHKDGRNSTRIALIFKEIVFLVHALMVVQVTEVVRGNFSFWFGHMFGLFFLLGLLCWFFVFFRGLYSSQQP